ncbi:MAG: prolipoprotein diacylglyceryl transferase family protein [Bacteroidota bacterium]
MLPELFSFGPIHLYSFGLMMGIAFLVANYLLVRELRRRQFPNADQIASTVTLISLAGGIIGSKLFSLLENWSVFIKNPVGEIFSAAGLTFYGGLIVVVITLYIYIRRKGIPFLKLADATSPSLIIGYGIGRIGCQLAGDGDYGIPSDLPWAMGYPNGTVSTLSAHNGELVEKFHQMFPGRPVPADIQVHPAPAYETLAALAIFALLWSLRKRPMATGKIFGIYLICAGLERLLVEFIRLNPLYLGLSQAQWISVGMIGLGAAILVRLRNAPIEEIPFVTSTTKRPRPAAAKAAR